MTNQPGPRGPLNILTEAAATLARSTDLDSTLERLLGLGIDTLNASLGVVYLQDPDRVELQLGVAVGAGDEAGAMLEAALGGPDDPVAATSRDRAPRNLAAADMPDALRAQDLSSAAVRPLTVSRGGIDIPLGVLLLAWRKGGPGPDGDAIVLAIADLAAVAIDRGRLASMILERSEWFERMAHTDPLTGLANQRTFARILELELARAARQGSEISLAILDVDGLTATNEALGHGAGDDILRAVASVLAESVRLVDTVARYGGDEFVLIAPGSAGAMVAQRVLDGVRALPVSGPNQITVSAGVARFPMDGASAEELFAAAQAALAAAQAAGTGQIASAGMETGRPSS